MEESSSTPSSESNYHHLKLSIKKQLEAFQVVASFSPQLSSHILIHNIEQVLAETEGSETEQEQGGHHDDCLFGLTFRDIKEESKSSPGLPGNFEVANNSVNFGEMGLKSWERTCLNVLDSLPPPPPQSSTGGQSLTLDLGRIKNQLVNRQYETPMDFHSDVILSLKTAHVTHLLPGTMMMTSQAGHILSAYMGNETLTQLFVDHRQKCGEALASIAKPKTGEISKNETDGVENPFTESRLLEAEQYLATRKEGTITVYVCLICKSHLKTNRSKARFHVLRVHFMDRYLCTRCSKKFYKMREFQTHKSSCLVKKQELPTTKNEKLAAGAKGIQSKLTFTGQLPVVRNVTSQFDLTRALTASVELEPLQLKHDKGNNTRQPEKRETASKQKVRSLIKKSKDKFRCGVAGCNAATFGDEKRAARHIRMVHLREQNHFCGACGKGFFYRYSLRDHGNACREVKKKAQIHEMSILTPSTVLEFPSKEEEEASALKNYVSLLNSMIY